MIHTTRIAPTVRCLLALAAWTVLRKGTLPLPGAGQAESGKSSLTPELRPLLGAPMAALLAVLLSCGALVLQAGPASAATPAGAQAAAVAPGLPTMAGTSPSIAGLSGGGYEIAFQGSNGDLWTTGTAGTKDWGLQMKAGTSPSITALSGGGYQVAVQASNGDLWTVGTAGTIHWGLGMKAGTSPSITALSSSFGVAFQANTGSLWTAASAGVGNRGLGMMAGTSPSITARSGGGYYVAFQANTGSFWTLTVTGTGGSYAINWGFGMMAGTSPSMTVLSNGTPEMAFQANTGSLWTFYPANGYTYYKNWQLGMMAGTSPSIAALPGGGFEIAFQANTGHLFITGSGAGSRFLDAGAGMMAGTSPSITALAGGGFEIAFQDSAGQLVAIGNASPPTITAVLTPAHPASTGWYNRTTGAPTVSFVCSFAWPGIAGTCPAAYTFPEGTNQSHSGTVTDKLGNSATAGVSGINVDTTPPTITPSITPAHPASTGWYNRTTGAPTVSYSCSDATSGIAGSCPAAYTFLEGANQSHSVTVSDKAGNSSTATVSGIKVDLTPPTVTYTGNAGTYTPDQTINITCSASDALSGVASTTCKNISGPAYSFGLGSHTYSATATDKAGNVGTGSTSFTVIDTVAGLCTLTKQYVTDQQIATSLCTLLSQGKYAGYIALVQAYSHDSQLITPAHAALLIQLAQAL